MKKWQILLSNLNGDFSKTFESLMKNGGGWGKS